MHDKIAHTAEHAFIGCLQFLLGHTLNVRKVVHRQPGQSTVHILIPKLDTEIVLKAEKMTNRLISEGRQVRVDVFDSLDAARSKISNLRANEERISGRVRVVHIDGHDVAACSMEHVQDLAECGFFLVTRIAASGAECEIDFSTGEQAKNEAIDISANLFSICGILGANPKTLTSTAIKLKSEHELNLQKLRYLSNKMLVQLAPVLVNGKFGKVTMISGVCSNLSDDQVVEFAGSKIKSGDNIVICIANTCGEVARVVLARSELGSIGIDMNELFRRYCGETGKGGGRPHFVTGIITEGSAPDFVRRVVDEFQAIEP